MSEVQTGAAMPARQTVTETVNDDIKTAERSKTRVIFFAGDTIEPRIKHSMPDRAFGGIHIGHIRTVKHGGNTGMLYKCALTPLKVKMIGEAIDRIHPQDRDNWIDSYRISNGRFNPATREWEDVEVNIPHMKHRRAYPGDDIRRVLRRGEGNAEGGIVEITALAGASDDAIWRAQLFFFPDWIEIQQGYKPLPKTLRELETHLRARLSAVASSDVDSALYSQIGREMLSSCVLYRNWGMEYLKEQEEMTAYAKLKGFGYSYPPKAEMVLEQLEQKRKDDLAQGQFSSMEDFIKVQMEANRLKDEELKLMRAQLGQSQATSDNISVPDKNPAPASVVTTTTTIRSEDAEVRIMTDEETVAPEEEETYMNASPKCSWVKNDGSFCVGKVVKEVDGQPYCSFHPKKGE